MIRETSSSVASLLLDLLKKLSRKMDALYPYNEIHFELPWKILFRW